MANPKGAAKSALASAASKLTIKLLKSMDRAQRKSLVSKLAKLALIFANKTRLRAIKNISKALPDLEIAEVKKLAFDAYENCAFGVVEAFWLEQLEPEIFCDEDTLRILQSEQGACIATMHLGCYEAVPLAVKKFASSSVTLTDIPNFIEHGEQFYTRAGITAIDKNSPHAFAQLLSHANSNSYISLHCDLYANEANVNFFNQATKAPAGIALLASLSKRPLLLGYASYQPNGKIKVCFETICTNIDLNSASSSKELTDRLMQEIYQRFEQIIKQHPEQWYWSYKRWR